MTEAPPYPQKRTCPYEPPPGYQEIGERGPVLKVTLFDGREAWMVTGYRESREILTHPNLSSQRTHPGFPIVAPRFRSQIARNLALIAMDPPVHDTYRRYLNPHFSLRTVRGMRPQLEDIVSGYIDAIIDHGSPADLVPMLAVPLPSLVICRHLGVPYEDHDFFQDASGKVMLGTEEESATATRTWSTTSTGWLPRRSRNPPTACSARWCGSGSSPATSDTTNWSRSRWCS